MSHSGPFFLILLCFRQKPLYIRRLGLSNSFPKLFQHISFILQANIRNPKAELESMAALLAGNIRGFPLAGFLASFPFLWNVEIVRL